MCAIGTAELVALALVELTGRVACMYENLLRATIADASQAFLKPGLRVLASFLPLKLDNFLALIAFDLTTVLISGLFPSSVSTCCFDSARNVRLVYHLCVFCGVWVVVPREALIFISVRDVQNIMLREKSLLDRPS